MRLPPLGRTMLRTLTSAILIVVLAACAVPMGRVEIDPYLRKKVDPSAEPEAWLTVGIPFQFHVMIPPEYARSYRPAWVTDAEGEDWEWRNTKCRVVAFKTISSFWPEPDEKLKVYADWQEKVDGRTTLIRVAFDQRGTFAVPSGLTCRAYIVAARYRDSKAQDRLFMVATTRDPEEIPTLLAVLRSVRIDGE